MDKNRKDKGYEQIITESLAAKSALSKQINQHNVTFSVPGEEAAPVIWSIGLKIETQNTHGGKNLL